MASCLNPAFPSAAKKGIWLAYLARAEKLNIEAVNPLLAKYIELVSLQARLSSLLIETLKLPHNDGDRALISCFNGEALRPLLTLAERELKANDQNDPTQEEMALLEDLWNQVEEFTYPRDFAARLVLEVFATHISALPHKEFETTSDRCPHCGFPIQCLIAREEGLGKRRSAVCSICSSEWPVPRLGCLHCGEQEASRLPVFSFDTWPNIRVEVCDSCGGYLKSIDMTKDADALPIPDDVASSAINIWAFERDYEPIGRHFFNL
jgi:formate dehydrogenase accessory protein FdhE